MPGLMVSQYLTVSNFGEVKALMRRKSNIVAPESFYSAEALEYVYAWRRSSADTPAGKRLTALMISKEILDSSVPMSLHADHSNIQFNYLTSGIGSCEAEIH